MLTERDRHEVLSKVMYICDELCTLIACANSGPVSGLADEQAFRWATEHLCLTSTALYQESLEMEWAKGQDEEEEEEAANDETDEGDPIHFTHRLPGEPLPPLTDEEGE